MKEHAHDRKPAGADLTAKACCSRLSAWDARLIEVITDCEDDIRRYRNMIEQVNGVSDCNASILERCMENDSMHRHLTLFTALHIVGLRFDRACESSVTVNDKLLCAAAQLRRHVELIGVMMQAMIRQVEQRLKCPAAQWDYQNSLLAYLMQRRLQLAIDEATVSLHEQFSCTLITVLMNEIEPAMKSVQDRLSLRPELPLDVKAFAGTMLGLKCNCHHGAPIVLADLASDISRIFKIPRTICLSA
ncbi:MAG: hypothetical protein JWP38_1102 [Herbaspirillum sp.]|jgi:hypothetical protein|nr:hypothetical protein [Herbaspirillum sp.]